MFYLAKMILLIFAILIFGIMPSSKTNASEPKYKRLAMSEWISMLSSEEAGKIAEAGYSITKFGPLARDAIPFLLKNLGSEDVEILKSNLTALVSISDIPGNGIETILGLTRHESPDVRIGAIKTLAFFPALSKKAERALLKILKNKLSNRR